MSFASNWSIQPGDIVFLGDSLTAGSSWKKAFPHLPVKNHGIAGDTARGVLRRLDRVVQGQPGAIFLMIGINDLYISPFSTNTELLYLYEEILNKIQEKTPKTLVFTQSILPSESFFAERITQLNLEIEKLSRPRGYTHIDLFPHFADADGALRNTLTDDGVHLLPAGYDLWTKLLTPYLEKP